MSIRLPASARAAYDWANISCPLGWEDVLKRLLDRLDEVVPGYVLRQIKPDMGGLDVYLESDGSMTSESRREAQEAIQAARQESATTCEACGTSPASGVMTNDYWLARLCAEHEATPVKPGSVEFVIAEPTPTRAEAATALMALLNELPEEFSQDPATPDRRHRERFEVIHGRNVEAVHQALWTLQRHFEADDE